MFDQYKTLLESENIISLRTAWVVDDGNLVSFRLMPADTTVSRRAGRNWWVSKDFEWVSQDQAFLYRHAKTFEENKRLARTVHRWQLDLRQMRFEKPPVFRLVWLESGHSVAVFLCEEPWAFIDEASHKGYSKGVFRMGRSVQPFAGNQWDQALFDKLFHGDATT